MITAVPPADLLEIAVDGARRAADLLLERFHAPATGVSTKSSPTDLVSDADRDSEALLRALVREHRPEDGILAEEGAGVESRSGLIWIIDPLDATINFLFGIPHWAVSIAVADAAGPIAGVVLNPNLDECFSAARHNGARLNGRPIEVSQESDLTKALIGTGFAYDVETRSLQAQVAARVIPRVRDIRRAGSAALDLAAVAAGRLDGFFEAHLGPWDRAAGELLVRAAGGTVSELPDPVGVEDGVVASGPALHGALRGLVSGSAEATAPTERVEDPR
jgi:myo-inositol-1(or 4)-monophosphatase